MGLEFMPHRFVFFSIAYRAPLGWIAVIGIEVIMDRLQGMQFNLLTVNKAARYAEETGDSLSSKGGSKRTCFQCGNKCGKNMGAAIIAELPSTNKRFKRRKENVLP